MLFPHSRVVADALVDGRRVLLMHLLCQMISANPFAPALQHEVFRRLV